LKKLRESTQMSAAKRIKGLEARLRHGKGLPGPFGDPRVYALRLARCEGNPYAFEFGFGDVEYLRRSVMCSLIMAEVTGAPEDWAEHEVFNSLFLELGTKEHGATWVNDSLAKDKAYVESIVPVVREAIAYNEEKRLREKQQGHPPPGDIGEYREAAG